MRTIYAQGVTYRFGHEESEFVIEAEPMPRTVNGGIRIPEKVASAIGEEMVRGY